MINSVNGVCRPSPVTLLVKMGSRSFAYWDYAAEKRELVHRRSGYRVALELTLTSPKEMLRCIFRVHDKPWGDAKVLDELVELLGTYFKGEWLTAQQSNG